ncbi:hypothetical protein [Reichenbachiella versicolor]|uniref:hypothetical protein n=1 Tax=Reichenbachiella versicolor TaxID=1821036 RepID=UPI000D6DE4C8|nr:hypothetical protein [Reichenbachiella versicolor]
MTNSVDKYFNEHVISQVKKIEAGSTIEEMVAGLEYISEQYHANHDAQVRKTIRAKMSEMLDYIFDHGLEEKVQITNYMLYD